MRISDWSSDVCSSDLCFVYSELLGQLRHDLEEIANQPEVRNLKNRRILILVDGDDGLGVLHAGKMLDRAGYADGDIDTSEEHTYELQSLMRISYAVFCLKKTNTLLRIIIVNKHVPRLQQQHTI